MRKLNLRQNLLLSSDLAEIDEDDRMEDEMEREETRSILGLAPAGVTEGE